MKSTLDQSTKENEGFSSSNVAANRDISGQIVNTNDEGEGKERWFFPLHFICSSLFIN